jgi:hypothetical protein
VLCRAPMSGSLVSFSYSLPLGGRFAGCPGDYRCKRLSEFDIIIFEKHDSELAPIILFAYIKYSCKNCWSFRLKLIRC